MEVRIGAGDLHRLVPDQRVRAGAGVPVELDEVRLARGVDQPEGVHAEALHRPVAARDRAVRHRPHQHVGDLRHQRGEVPERVVRRAGLRHREVRLGLGRVHQVRELHRVLDEEDRDVVADQIPVALVGVELHGEAADVARGVGRAALAEHGREAHEHRRLLAGLGEQRGARVLRQSLVALEVAVRRRAARVDDALGNALVVEVRDLLAEDEVLEQRRPAQAGLERVLVVRDRHALIGRQRPLGRIDADPIERADRRVLADDRRAAAGLLRAVRLGHRARADDRVRGDRPRAPSVGSAQPRPQYSPRFVRVERHAAARFSVPAPSPRAHHQPGGSGSAGPLTVARLLALLWVRAGGLVDRVLAMVLSVFGRSSGEVRSGSSDSRSAVADEVSIRSVFVQLRVPALRQSISRTRQAGVSPIGPRLRSGWWPGCGHAAIVALAHWAG